MAVSCVQGRAVMIDLEAHFGRSGQIVGYEELMRVLEVDKIVVEPGDFVCIRTAPFRTDRPDRRRAVPALPMRPRLLAADERRGYAP